MLFHANSNEKNSVRTIFAVSKMARKHQKTAAALARAARLASYAANNLKEKPEKPEKLRLQAPEAVMSDSDSDCEYVGGVDYRDSESEYSSGLVSEEGWDSFSEMEDDDFEMGLAGLREEVTTLQNQAQSPYQQILEKTLID